ncbi:MAG: hypothetical protein K8R69_06810 [Deltaproteobacteria bacterium]|nr:hypothetical protein [Deltaproteobacteria bacterium]
MELLLTFVLERLKEAPNRFPSAVQSLIRYPHPSVRLMLYNAIDALAQRPDTHERYQPLFSALWTNESDFIAQDLVSENRLRSELAKKIAEFFAEFIEKRGRSQKVPGSPPSESN